MLILFKNKKIKKSLFFNLFFKILEKIIDFIDFFYLERNLIIRQRWESMKKKSLESLTKEPLTPYVVYEKNGWFRKATRKTFDECLTAIETDPAYIRRIKNPCETLVLKAIQKNPNLIQYIKKPSEVVCLETVKLQGGLLGFLSPRQRTPHVCLEAVRQNGYALQFVEHQTEQICLEAVRQKGWALAYVHHPTPEICLEAIKNDGRAIEWVAHPTIEMSLTAIKTYPSWMSELTEMPESFYLEAVKRNPSVFPFIKNPTAKVLFEAVKQDGRLIQHISTSQLTRKICGEAIKQTFLTFSMEQKEGFKISTLLEKSQKKELIATELLKQPSLFDIIPFREEELSKIQHLIPRNQDFSFESYQSYRIQLRLEQLSVDQSPYHFLSDELHSFPTRTD